MKRKVAALILASLMTVSIAGCGQDTGGTENTGSQQTAEKTGKKERVISEDALPVTEADKNKNIVDISESPFDFSQLTFTLDYGNMKREEVMLNVTNNSDKEVKNIIVYYYGPEKKKVSKTHRDILPPGATGEMGYVRPVSNETQSIEDLDMKQIRVSPPEGGIYEYHIDIGKVEY